MLLLRATFGAGTGRKSQTERADDVVMVRSHYLFASGLKQRKKRPIS
jgi:hypothetical protein